MHLILQKLDENVDYDIEKIEELIVKLQNQNIITQKGKEAVNKNDVYKFTNSNIWKEMKNAKEIQKERPFYINIPASEIYDEDIEEEILVQGIIDLYYITKDNRLVLVDYKTDRVNEEKELIDKYKIQLSIYKRALEKALNRKVDNIYLYSVYLGKEVEV